MALLFFTEVKKKKLGSPLARDHVQGKGEGETRAQIALGHERTGEGGRREGEMGNFFSLLFLQSRLVAPSIMDGEGVLDKWAH